MALQYSTALRNFLQGFGSKKQALMNGILELRSGSMPTSADAALTGTILRRYTPAGASFTAEVLSSGTVTLSGSGGQVDSITVNSVQLLASSVVYTTSLTATAALVASAINSNFTSPKYMASSSGAVVTIKALPGTGTGPNGYVVLSTASGGTLAATPVNLSGGVAVVNGLQFGEVTSGILAKSGTWSGIAAASGDAGYFVFHGSRVDGYGADSAPWTLIRLMGTCGTGPEADFKMASVAITIGANDEIETWTDILYED